MKLEDIIGGLLIGKTIKVSGNDSPLLITEIVIAGDMYQDAVVYLNPGAERHGLAFDEPFEVVDEPSRERTDNQNA